jgi:hypothetical protein
MPEDSLGRVRGSGLLRASFFFRFTAQNLIQGATSLKIFTQDHIMSAVGNLDAYNQTYYSNLEVILNI